VAIILNLLAGFAQRRLDFLLVYGRLGWLRLRRRVRSTEGWAAEP